MKNNKKLRNITKNINNKGVKRREETRKQSFTEKFLSVAFWLLLSLLACISLYFHFSSRKNIEPKSSEIGFFVTLILLFLIVFFLITIKGSGKTIYDLILRVSSIILLIMAFSIFPVFYIIINLPYLYIIFLLVSTVIWTYVNNLGDSKVVKSANSVVAVILAIASYVNGFIWDILKIKDKFQTIGFQIEGVEITYELIFKIIIFPLFCMTAICSLYSTYKSFRLEDNKNINK